MITRFPVTSIQYPAFANASDAYAKASAAACGRSQHPVYSPFKNSSTTSTAISGILLPFFTEHTSPI